MEGRLTSILLLLILGGSQLSDRSSGFVMALKFLTSALFFKQLQCSGVQFLRTQPKYHR